MKRWEWLLILGPALLGGCYGAKVLRQPVTVEETAQDLEAVRQQQAAVDSRLAELEKRSAEQAELLRSLKADSFTRWSDFETRLGAIDAKLRDALGSREGYARNPSIWSAAPPGAARREPERPTAGETPPAAAGSAAGEREAGTSSPPATGTEPSAVPAGADTAAARPLSSEAEGKRVYDQAYKDLTRGNYSLAILGFREFLRRSPTSDLADNAQYWVGECSYAQRDFGAAIREFLRVPELWPQGDKVPAALLKTGYSYLQLDDRANARTYLNRVVEEFPDSEEAVQAKNKIRSAL